MNDTPSRGKPQARKFLAPRTPPAPGSCLYSGGNTSDGVRREGVEAFPPIAATDLPADAVVARLKALGRRITGHGPHWQACCPAHADTKPSLSITETAEGVLLVKCFAGCDTEDVLAKLGLTPKHLFPSLYALQFGERRPQGRLTFRGGGGDEAQVVEPTDEVCAEWERRLAAWPIPSYALNQLAVHLGLPREALLKLEVGYWEEEACWVFPERDDKRRIVGLVRRYDGSKCSIDGSHRGLTIPRYGKRPPSGPIYLVEGASDTAALVSVGAFAVGRSNAFGNAAERLWLTRLLALHPDREVVVVGEREASGAGVRGAEKLAAFLRETLERPVSWALPREGYKDGREQVVAGKWYKGLCTQEVSK